MPDGLRMTTERTSSGARASAATAETAGVRRAVTAVPSSSTDGLSVSASMST